MSNIRIFNIHRPWEDWLGMLLGVLIGFSPWLADPPHDDSLVMWNAVLVGTAVLGLAQLEYASQRRWEELGEMACGLWLIAAPLVLGYAEHGTLGYWHVALGSAVVLIAALELSQAWAPADKTMAERRQS